MVAAYPAHVHRRIPRVYRIHALHIARTRSAHKLVSPSSTLFLVVDNKRQCQRLVLFDGCGAVRGAPQSTERVLGLAEERGPNSGRKGGGEMCQAFLTLSPSSRRIIQDPATDSPRRQILTSHDIVSWALGRTPHQPHLGRCLHRQARERASSKAETPAHFAQPIEGHLPSFLRKEPRTLRNVRRSR